MKRNIWPQLQSWKNKTNRKPLILHGARQVGKTYILNKFGESSFSSYYYINFEKDQHISAVFEPNLNPKRILNELEFHFEAKINIDSDLLIFDEIQETPAALTSLKYFNEDMPSLAICAAGSLLGLQLSPQSFPVGKVEFLDLYPLSFDEFLLGIGDERSYEYVHSLDKQTTIPEIVHLRLWDQLKYYFIVGGLPDVVRVFRDNMKNPFIALDKVREEQTNAIKTYLADIAKHSGKQNAMHIERTWQNIPSQLARTQDGSASKFRFKGIIPGISRYAGLADSIDWLLTAGIIMKVGIINNGNLPFSAYIVQNSFKLYIFDVGILGALSGLLPQTILNYDYGSYKGYFAENFVAQEFLSAGVKGLYCWKGRTSEVEFLREHHGQILPVEVKSGGVTQSKSLKVFAEKYPTPYRTIMSAKPLCLDNTHHIHRYPLYLAGKFPL